MSNIENNVSSVVAPSNEFDSQPAGKSECDADTSMSVRPENKCVIVEGVCCNGCIIKKIQVSHVAQSNLLYL